MIQFLGDIYLDKKYKCEFDLTNFILNLEYPISIRGNPAKNKINLHQENHIYLKHLKDFLLLFAYPIIILWIMVNLHFMILLIF